MKALINEELIRLMEERREKSKMGKQLDDGKKMRARVYIWLLKNIYGMKMPTLARNCSVSRQDLYTNYYEKIDKLIGEYGVAIIFMFVEKIQININPFMLEEPCKALIGEAPEINMTINSHNDIDIFDGRVIFKHKTESGVEYSVRVQDGVVDVYTYKEGRFIGVFRVKNMCIKIYPKVSKNKQKSPII